MLDIDSGIEAMESEEAEGEIPVSQLFLIFSELLIPHFFVHRKILA